MYVLCCDYCMSDHVSFRDLGVLGERCYINESTQSHPCTEDVIVPTFEERSPYLQFVESTCMAASNTNA